MIELSDNLDSGIRKVQSMEYTTAEVNRDDNGDIDIDYYRTAAADIIRREAEQNNIDPARMSTNQFHGLMYSVYRALFRPDGRKEKDQGHDGGRMGYTESEAEKIAQVYIELCNIYNVRPSQYGFGIMTGIDETKTLQHLTRAKSKIQNSTKSAVLNKLFDTPVGAIALANNDPETGLMFARQNMIASQEIKHIDSISQLEDMRKRSQDNVSRIEQKEED